MKLANFVRVIVVIGSVFLLSACDTAEERAEKHYQNGLRLLQAGDESRALLEFKNVFKLDSEHLDARLIYAKTVLARGNTQEAYGQYLRIAEQDPTNVEARKAMAGIALRSNNWDAAAVQGGKALELAPDDPSIQAIGLALRYHDALTVNNIALQKETLEKALALKAVLPTDEILRNLMIEGLIRDGQESAALREIDETIALFPENILLYRLRLQLLTARGDDAAVEQRLREMVAAFPDDQTSKSQLIRFYMSRNDLDRAETFLRGQITPDKRDDDSRITLVQFLATARGYDAARSELDKLIEEGTNTDRFRAMRAGLDFDAGKHDQAIAELQDIVTNAPASAQTHDIKITLARILAQTGNEVGARALVEGVLEEDPGMVEALKMQAQWYINNDQTDLAINSLRKALDQSPSDPSIMTIMAGAHMRNGDRELAGELLALAVNASARAPAESLRYARFLVSANKPLAAESVLLDALRQAPGNIDILTDLGSIYVQLKDWPRAEQVERALRGMNSPATLALADQIRLAILRGKENYSDALAFLESLSQEQGDNTAAKIAIIRSHMLGGNPQAARSYLNQLLAENPDSSVFKFLDAAVASANGDFKAAEDRYRALLAENDKIERLWLELVRTLSRDGRDDEAKTTLDQALNVLPEGRDLRWAKATFLERDGDLEGAIKLYESLYSENTSTSVIANNLASLLSVARDDDQSLERAYAVARRLRGSDFPPYQDTYGWIAYRRGNISEALENLEPAARGLPQDPLVQYHLGMAYLAANRDADALRQLRLAVDLAGDDSRPQFEAARQEIARLEQGE